MPVLILEFLHSSGEVGNASHVGNRAGWVNILEGSEQHLFSSWYKI